MLQRLNKDIVTIIYRYIHRSVLNTLHIELKQKTKSIYISLSRSFTSPIIHKQNYRIYKGYCEIYPHPSSSWGIAYIGYTQQT